MSSAAEKLKALLNGRAGFPSDERHVGDSDVTAALPQIVAVVEAAEQNVYGMQVVRVQKLAVALAALEEALP